MKKVLKNQKGSIVLEMLLGIALFIIVLPMLMNAIQERNKRLEEQAIASQINLIRDAANNYLSENKDKEIENASGVFEEVIPEGITVYRGTSSVPDDENLRILKGYGIKEDNLTGLLDGNSLGQVYHLVLSKEVDVAAGTMFTKGYVLVTKGDLTQLRLKRIANTVGFSAGVIKTERNSAGDSCTSVIDDYILQECIASTSGDLFQVPNNIYTEVNTATYRPGADDTFMLIALTDGDVVVSEFLYKDKTSSDSNIENTLLVDLDFHPDTLRGGNKNLYDVYNANMKSLNISTVGNPYGTESSLFENVSVGTFISNSNVGTSVSPVQYIENQDEGNTTINVNDLTLGHIITRDLDINTGLFNIIQIDKEVTANNLVIGSTSPVTMENLILAIDDASPLNNLGTAVDPVQTISGLSGSGTEALIKLSGTLSNDINVATSLSLGDNEVGIVIQDTSSFDFDTNPNDQLTIAEMARLNPAGETSMVKDISLTDNAGNNYYILTNVLYPTECTATTNCPMSSVFKALYDMQKAMQISHFCFERDRLVDSVYEANCPLTRVEITTIRDEITALQNATLSGNINSISTAVDSLRNAIITGVNPSYW